MLVSRAIEGLSVPTILSISPTWSMPISNTPYRESSCNPNILKGRPYSLFRFPGVLAVGPMTAVILERASLVVLFPQLPVIPMVLTDDRRCR